MRLLFALVGLSTLAGLIGACGERGSEVIVVGAAASLRPLCEASAPDFERMLGNPELMFAFAASSALARQVEAGAKIDVLLSADRVTLERVIEGLEPGSITPFLANRLALVVRAERAQEFGDPWSEGSGRVAVGSPLVPLGNYARAYLERVGRLGALEPLFVNADSARAAVALVLAGAADRAIVYASDARSEPRVRVLWEQGADEEPRIVYHCALVRGAADVAGAYVAFLGSEAFRARARALGFQVDER